MRRYFRQMKTRFSDGWADPLIFAGSGGRDELRRSNQWIFEFSIPTETAFLLNETIITVRDSTALPRHPCLNAKPLASLIPCYLAALNKQLPIHRKPNKKFPFVRNFSYSSPSM